MTETSRDLSRRTIIKGAAWSVPVVAAAVAVPMAAASGGAADNNTAAWYFADESVGEKLTFTSSTISVQTNFRGEMGAYSAPGTLNVTFTFVQGAIPSGLALQLSNGFSLSAPSITPDAQGRHVLTAPVTSVTISMPVAANTVNHGNGVNSYVNIGTPSSWGDGLSWPFLPDGQTFEVVASMTFNGEETYTDLTPSKVLTT